MAIGRSPTIACVGRQTSRILEIDPGEGYSLSAKFSVNFAHSISELCVRCLKPFTRQVWEQENDTQTNGQRSHRGRGP